MVSDIWSGILSARYDGASCLKHFDIVSTSDLTSYLTQLLAFYLTFWSNILIWQVFWHSFRHTSRHESIILWDILYKVLLVLLWLHNLGLLRFVFFSCWPPRLMTPGSLCLLCFSIARPPCNKWYNWFSTVIAGHFAFQSIWQEAAVAASVTTNDPKQGRMPFWLSHGFTQ